LSGNGPLQIRPEVEFAGAFSQAPPILSLPGFQVLHEKSLPGGGVCQTNEVVSLFTREAHIPGCSGVLWPRSPGLPGFPDAALVAVQEPADVLGVPQPIRRVLQNVCHGIQPQEAADGPVVIPQGHFLIQVILPLSAAGEAGILLDKDPGPAGQVVPSLGTSCFRPSARGPARP
jgi:hypothetical protein